MQTTVRARRYSSSLLLLLVLPKHYVYTWKSYYTREHLYTYIHIKFIYHIILNKTRRTDERRERGKKIWEKKWKYCIIQRERLSLYALCTTNRFCDIIYFKKINSFRFLYIYILLTRVRFPSPPSPLPLILYAILCF